MSNAAQVLSLFNAEAGQWNRDLLLEFQAALERDPAADLMSIIPDDYRCEHRNAQYRELSYGAQINLQTVNELRDRLERDPEVNLLPVEKDTTERQGPPEFRTRLDIAETATVVFRLSEKVTTLLAQYSDRSDDESNDLEGSLLVSLNRLLWDSTVLWESPIRGVVVKCNEDIVAKVITGNKDFTEYTSMQYLAERAPDIPAPRPHGLIIFGPFRVIFMSYIQDMTLAKVWHSLSHEEKLSIQHQLDDIFRRLRTLRQDDGNMLGGVCGEGAKEYYVNERGLWKDITTAKEFNDLQFSARHHGSTTYVKLLRSFLANDNTAMRGSVFSHGDVRRENIMVKWDPDNDDAYVITGIIDWEDSGFYPEYFECTALTGNLSLVNEDDWYL